MSLTRNTGHLEVSCMSKLETQENPSLSSLPATSYKIAKKYVTNCSQNIKNSSLITFSFSGYEMAKFT